MLYANTSHNEMLFIHMVTFVAVHDDILSHYEIIAVQYENPATGADQRTPAAASQRP